MLPITIRESNAVEIEDVKGDEKVKWNCRQYGRERETASTTLPADMSSAYDNQGADPESSIGFSAIGSPL